MIGAKRDAIEMAEDRKLFREAMDRIGLENPRATIVSAPREGSKYNIAAGDGGRYGALSRMSACPRSSAPPSRLGGTGGGVAYNREQYAEICRRGLDASPVAQILVDESLLGWKEFEMEVVRDTRRQRHHRLLHRKCRSDGRAYRRLDHRGARADADGQGISDHAVNASIAVLREIGVETGGSNVQWAVNPDDGRMVVIEMNPRVSRSSALASKATGFPIAKIAAKLAVGYTLDELDNDITKVTPASFEPTIDYVVTKIPRFAFEKFPGSEPTLTTAMKSVGEAMAIGRTFHESLQKALTSMETGLTGLDEIDIPGADDPAGGKAAIIKALSAQTPDRLRIIAQAMREGLDDDEIQGHHQVSIHGSSPACARSWRPNRRSRQTVCR